MTPEAYAAALAGAEPVVYHEDFCRSVRSLATFPCDCGADDELRRKRNLLGLPVLPWPGLRWRAWS